MNMDETTVVDTESIADENIKKELEDIYNDLNERGYEPTKQIVAYLISGDPGYISAYKDCRNRILKFTREDIIELMFSNFINK